MNNGKDRNELKFVRVVKRSEDFDWNFRKTKTSIGDSKEARSALVPDPTCSKTNNSDVLLNSIIQSRCLTKDQERIATGNLKDYKNSPNQGDYFDAKQKIESKGTTSACKDAKLRKSITSNKERKDERISLREKEMKESKEPVEDDIDKPWISYLRNLRIPMMCQLHRKITFAISEHALKATPPQSKKRDKSPTILKRRNLNRNPNCNHNSKFYFIGTLPMLHR